MTCDVRWDVRVPEGLRGLPPEERRQVVAAILSLADEPVPAGARPLGEPPGPFRLVLGRFWIVYVFDPRSNAVIVYQVLKDGQLLNA